MSIQISVIIWTVICFLLLMLILKNWLFKPVLEVMEKRRNRIEKANEKKLEAQRLTVEHEKALEEQKSAFLKEQKIKVDEEKTLVRLSTGAQPTDTVRNILSKAGIMEKFHNQKQGK